MVAAWREITGIGGAQVGDKTLVDALEPFATTLQAKFDGGAGLGTGLDDRGGDRRTGCERDRRHRRPDGPIPGPGQKSLGTPDPGANSLAACMRALLPVLDPQN